MATARSYKKINASPDVVWAAVTDPETIAEWFPVIKTATKTDRGRNIVLEDGAAITEDIVTNDSDLRRFQYVITGGDMPIESHLGTVDVLDVDGSAVVVYSTEVEPAALAEAFAPLTDAALDGLAAHVGA